MGRSQSPCGPLRKNAADCQGVEACATQAQGSAAKICPPGPCGYGPPPVVGFPRAIAAQAPVTTTHELGSRRMHRRQLYSRYDLDSVSNVPRIGCHGECDLPMRRQLKHRVRSTALFKVQGRAMSSIKSISAEKQTRPIGAPDERMRPRCAHVAAAILPHLLDPAFTQDTSRRRMRFCSVARLAAWDQAKNTSCRT
jgi:hypothetical protein